MRVEHHSYSSFIALNVHWIDEQFASQKKLIDMKPVEGKTAIEYRAAVEIQEQAEG